MTNTQEVMRLNKRIRVAAVTAMALTLCCGIQPALAATGQPLPVTKEQQEALQRYRSQQEILQQKERQIRTVMGQLKVESKQLRGLVNGRNKTVRAQVKADLMPFHDKLKKAFHLHKAGEALNKKIHAARANRDLVQLRTLSSQLVNTKQAQLDLLKSAHQDLQAELKKVRALR